MLNGKVKAICFAFPNVLRDLHFVDYSKINFSDFDKIIFLNAKTPEIDFPNAIYFEQLIQYFTIRTYAEIPLLYFIRRHPKTKLITMTFPQLPIKFDSEFAKLILERHDLMNKIKSSGGTHFPNIFDNLGYNNEETYKLISTPIVKTHLDGSTYMVDDEDPLIGIKNGKRMTAYQPEKYINKIYFVGGCHVYGINAPFNKNIPSYLQKMLSDYKLPYRVENESQFFAGRHQDIFYKLQSFFD